MKLTHVRDTEQRSNHMNMTTEQSTETNTEFEEHLVHKINSAICELFDIHAYENESVGFTDG